MPTEAGPRVSVIVPVRNEPWNLPIVVRFLAAVVRTPHEVLVVHDEPDDTTIPVAEELRKTHPGVRTVRNGLGPGVVNAVRAGVDAATAEYVLILPADDMGAVLSVEDMVALMDAGHDLVSATRYAHGGKVVGGFPMSRFLSRVVNLVLRLVLGSAFTDATVGIKMFRRSAFHALALEARPIGWAFALEMSLKAQLGGHRLGEVPIVSLNRLFAGKSSFRALKWAGEYARWFFWGVRRLIAVRFRPTPVSVRIPAPIQKEAG